MSRLAQLLKDPVFWITTIILGLLLGVVANYLTRFADRVTVIISARRRRSVENLAASVQKEASHLLKHPDERFDLKLDVLFYQGYQIKFAVVAAVALILAVGFALVGIQIHSLTALVASMVMSVTGFLAWVMMTVYIRRERRALQVVWAYEELRHKDDVED